MGHELTDWLCAIDAIAAPSIADARRLRQRDGGSLLEALVRLGAISDQSLTLLLRERLRLPIVAPAMLADIAGDALAALPADMAVEFRVMPLAIDGEGNLVVAFSDPSDNAALEEISFFTGRHVMRTIAMQAQIAWCLAKYYGVVTPLAEPLLVPADPSSVNMAATPRATVSSTNPAPQTVQPLVLPKKRAPRITEELIDATRRPAAGGDADLSAGVSTTRLAVATDVANSPTELAPRTGEIHAVSPRIRRLTDLPPVMIDLQQLGSASPVPAVVIDDPEPSAPPPVSRTRARSDTVVGYDTAQAIARATVAVTKHLTRDLASASRAIAAAPSRDDAIAEFLRSMFTDHIVFCVVRGDSATLHPSTGRFTPMAAIPSIGAALMRGRPYRGPLPDVPSQMFAAEALGQFMPLVVIVPVMLRQRAIAFSLAELTSRTPSDSELIALAQVTSNAFARLALRRRQTMQVR
ncbi:MAG: hypothetical protein IPL79_05095 [Myxococcales bacterium]|nr:hypothetical protein [Myxococcales bacterium]